MNRALLLSSLLAACGPAFAGGPSAGVIEGSVVNASGAVLSSGVVVGIAPTAGNGWAGTTSAIAVGTGSAFAGAGSKIGVTVNDLLAGK